MKLKLCKDTFTKSCKAQYGFLIFNILLIVLGCNNVDNSQNVDFFRYNEDADITTLDPAFVRSQSEIWACSQIFEGLVEFDNQLNATPCIAKSWEISNENKTYTFHLKNNVYFVDFEGNKRRKLTAQDFVYSFSRVADTRNASPGSWIFNDKIDSVSFANQDFENPLYPFKAINDSTFEINLVQAFSPFISLLANPYCFVVMKEEVEKQKKEFRSKPTGTGPFRLVTWDENVQMLLHKNPFYHQKEKGENLPKLEGVYIELNKNKEAAFMGFIPGRYDFFNGINPTVKDELFTQKGDLKDKHKNSFSLKSSPFLNSEFVGFYLDDKPNGMSQEDFYELRKILNKATNRQEIITFLKNGMGYPADNGFIPYGMAAFDSVRTAKTNYAPKEAYKWMTEHGYSNSNTLKLTLNTTADYVDIAVLLKNQWKKINVDLTIEIHPGSFLRKLRNQGKALLFRASWIADYPDPENFMAYFYSKFHSPNGPNYTHFTNDEFDKLYSSSMSEIDNEKRLKMLAEMDSIVAEECPVLFLFYDKTVRLVSNDVIGLEANPMNFLRLKNVSKIK